MNIPFMRGQNIKVIIFFFCKNTLSTKGLIFSQRTIIFGIKWSKHVQEFCNIPGL